ncbi:hypothetical protein Esi_0186_0026 [Ectocarpus siliculosus]|uniref:Uncharacterized protein n=1 Tax=Ectocarpus siliculosus TaxID=2880 RepID=D8LH23_ECTSI|nr:hypothetical protein Esi_0186_0026 [Ectocarpus siliculosus]|eukprot:CBN75876.1 hypothetical protein Esi_0186_0026 [Ectocarpus siliculosus]
MAGRGRSAGRGGSAGWRRESHSGKKNLTEAELLEGLSLNAEISGEALVEPAEAKAGVIRAATMKPGASVLERVYAVHSALEYYLAENTNVARLYRDADDE